MPIRRRRRGICGFNFELRSAHAMANFQAGAKVFPLTSRKTRRMWFEATLKGENVNLTEDFVATFDLDRAGSDTLQVITHRNPVSGQPSPTETAPVRSTNEPGFFAAEALLGTGQGERRSFGSAGARFRIRQDGGHPV